ncbi:MAG: hemolysin family protein [Bacillota bacterium]|jgi:putative hemolysin
MESDVPLLPVIIRSTLFLISFLIVGFFAGSETAFLSMDAWAVEGLKETGDRRAALLSALNEDSRNTTSAILIGTNVFTVLASVMGASLADLFRAGETFSGTILPLMITALMFFFSQLVPKTYASKSPTEMALAVAPLLNWITTVLKPMSTVLSLGPYLVAKFVGKKAESEQSISDAPVRLAVGLAAEEGQVDKEEGEVIVGVLDSSDTLVADIMVPLANAFVFSPETTVSDALHDIRQKRFSRVPVVSKDGNVEGLVYMKDVLRQAVKEPGCRLPVTSLMRPPLRVAPTDNILDVLAPMRKNRVHLAIVVDGQKPVGIVTLDDILEEIVGVMPEAVRGRPAQRKQSPPARVVVREGFEEGYSESDGFETVSLEEYVQ